MCFEETGNYRTYLRSNRSNKQAICCSLLNISAPAKSDVFHLVVGQCAALAACFCSFLKRQTLVEMSGARNGKHMADGRE
jgi:hypothetical protein